MIFHQKCNKADDVDDFINANNLPFDKVKIVATQNRCTSFYVVFYESTKKIA